MAHVLNLDNIKKPKADVLQLTKGGPKYEFRDLTLEESAEFSNSLKVLPAMLFEKGEDETLLEMHRLIQILVDIPDDVVIDLDIHHFEAIVKHVQRKVFYDKGFTDKEIDSLEKKALKKKLLDEMAK